MALTKAGHEEDKQIIQSKNSGNNIDRAPRVRVLMLAVPNIHQGCRGPFSRDSLPATSEPDPVGSFLMDPNFFLKMCQRYFSLISHLGLSDYSDFYFTTKLKIDDPKFGALS